MRRLQQQSLSYQRLAWWRRPSKECSTEPLNPSAIERSEQSNVGDNLRYFRLVVFFALISISVLITILMAMATSITFKQRLALAAVVPLSTGTASVVSLCSTPTPAVRPFDPYSKSRDHLIDPYAKVHHFETNTPLASGAQKINPLTLDHLDLLVGTNAWNTNVSNVTYYPLMKCPNFSLRTLFDNVKIDYNAVVRRLQGTHILMMGDSNTRYQYVNLAHYIQHKEWSAQFPPSEWEGYFPGWDDFFNTTTKRLKYEVCDCFRVRRLFPRNVRENRYYRNPILKINITLISQYGRNLVRAHSQEALHMSCDALKGCTSRVLLQAAADKAQLMPLFSDTFAWAYFVCLLQPDVFIVNMGHWVSLNDAADDVKQVGKVVQECTRNKTKLVFRATFPLCTNRSNRERRLRDWVKSREGKDCGWHWMDSFNLLKHAPCTKHFMHDEEHFTTNVVALINRMTLLQLLGPEVLESNPCM